MMKTVTPTTRENILEDLNLPQHCSQNLTVCVCITPCLWVRHHGMARPQVVDGGTASDMEGSCE